MKAHDIVKKYESFILSVLAVMMAAVVILATVDLGWMLLTYVMSPPLGLVEIGQLLEIFGMFMLVLIGIELFETVGMYQKDRVSRVEIAIIVALLAVARKVIILDYKSLTSFSLLDVGVAVLAFAVAYYLLHANRRSRLREKESAPKPSGTPQS
jgi:uncharacterized membrane protein (DUF373 family)